MDLYHNDPAVSFFKENGYTANYNQGMLRWLRDYYGVSNSTLPDLLAKYIKENGTGILPATITSITDLFSNNEEGAFFTASDTTTMFSDTGATTEVVADDPIAVHRSVDLGTGTILEREQSTLSLRPIYRVRSDGIGYIDYSGGKTWSITGSASSMKYMHDGTGGSYVSFIEKTMDVGDNDILVSSAVDSSETGFRVLLQSSTGNLFHTIYGGSASAATSILKASISSPIKMFTATYKDTGTNPVVYMYSDLSVDERSSDRINAPSTANSTSDITWGVNAEYNEYHSLFIDRVITRQESKKLYSFLSPTAKWAVPGTIDYALILLGQSNQSGRGDMFSTAAEDKQVGVYAYTKAEEFTLATVPEHSVVNALINTNPGEAESTPEHGTALRAGKNINTASGDTILLLPLAVGGTSIEQWDTPASISNPSTLYGFFKRQWDAVKGRITTPVIIMNGHEQTADDIGSGVIDLVNGGIGTAYVDEFTSFYNNLQSDITSTTDIPVIQVQLPLRSSASGAAKVGMGAEAQRQLEGILTNFHVVPSYDQPKQDAAHLTKAGYNVVADRIALAFREHVLGESVNGTGPRLVSATRTTTTTITLVYDKEIQAAVSNYSDFFRVHEEGIEQTISSVVRSGTTDVVITVSSAISGNITVDYGYITKADALTHTDIIKDTDGFPGLILGPLKVTIP